MPVALLSSSSAIAQAEIRINADTAEKQAKRSALGGMWEALVEASLATSAESGSEVYSLAMPAASYLGDELLKLLDCKEQQQAAKATDQAIPAVKLEPK